MQSIHLSDATLHALVWVVALLVIDYACVLLAVLIDLRSGTIKARRMGVPCTSGGYRRTVDKASRYFITLLALSVIDGLLMVAVMLLRSTAGWSIPALPLFTTIGALCLCLIEAKSVVENTQSKTDYTSTARAVNDLLSAPELNELLTNLRRLLKDP